MSLIPYDPFKQFVKLTKDIDQMFSSFFSFFDQQMQAKAVRVDIHETEKEIIAVCDLPGIDQDSIDIEVSHNTLRISGNMEQIVELDKANVYHRERYVGKFHRAVLLPKPVSSDKTKAVYKDGILEITMPKINYDRKKRIDIQKID